MARLVLVNYNSSSARSNKPPLGLGYLASYLKKRLDFHDITIVDGCRNITSRILKQNPDVVGFTVYSANHSHMIELIRLIKRKTDVVVLAGGPHITALPMGLSQDIDIGFIGEGEESLFEFMRLFLNSGQVSTQQLSKIDGLVFWDQGRLHITPPRSFIKHLDTIPFPDRDLLNMQSYMKPSQILMNNQYLRGTTMVTSRGCPFHCIYCHVSAKWGRPRFHSPDYIVEEMKILYQRYMAEAIYICDDLFSHTISRVEEIVRKMEREGLLGNLRFMVDLRASMVNSELVALLKRMGVVKVAIGIESGSDRILQFLKGSDVTVDQSLKAVEMLNRYGIGTHCCFMIGSPTETIEDIEKTRVLIEKILKMDRRNFCQLTVTTPLPGTRLWEYAIKRGLISKEVDWRGFSLSPLDLKRSDFYVNENIDFDLFKELVASTYSLCNSRRLVSILSNFSLRYLLRIVSDPVLSIRILRDFLKHQMARFWQGK